EAGSVKEVLEMAGVVDYHMEEYQISAVETAIALLLNPMLHGLLLMLIIGGIYFELQSPGVGFPGLAALIGAVLYFAPLYLEGLAANWEIAMFVLGLALLALEIFVIPGFGIAGLSGIMLIFFALIFTLIRNDFFDFEYVPSNDIVIAMFQVLAPIILMIILAVVTGKSIIKSRIFQKLVLKQTQAAAEGFTVTLDEEVPIIGKKGIVLADLRPAGKVDIGGRVYDASTDGEYVNKGQEVKVTEIMGNYIMVEKP
ncbi:MAG: nodulation protein NfeD, partial [Bacteroidetes bacterium]|nr:nodulation protein NfeD [Bacteroidota bacterium]